MKAFYWFDSNTKSIHQWKLEDNFHNNINLNNAGEGVVRMFSKGSYVYYVKTTGDVYRFKAEMNAKKEFVQRIIVDVNKFVVQQETSLTSGSLRFF